MVLIVAQSTLHVDPVGLPWWKVFDAYSTAESVSAWLRGKSNLPRLDGKGESQKDMERRAIDATLAALAESGPGMNPFG